MKLNKISCFALTRQNCVRLLSMVLLCCFTLGTQAQVTDPSHSVARNWMEVLLESIRNDFARPTVHARNLHHATVLMYDTWAAYQDQSDTYFLGKTVDGYTCEFNGITVPSNNILIESAQRKSLSYAMYRFLRHRFQNSPAAGTMFAQYDQYMNELGYNTSDVSTNYNWLNQEALGNYIAQEMIDFGLQDGSNEQNAYTNTYYQPVNTPLPVTISGNTSLSDFNRWQPLAFNVFIDQSGNVIPSNIPAFLSPEWGKVSNFCFNSDDLTMYQRSGDNYEVYCDPGPPPYIDTENGGGTTDAYQWGFALVAAWSSHLDANDNTMWDISPASIGNIQSYPDYTDLTQMQSFYDFDNGGDASVGHSLNPITGMPYAPQMVKRADYARVLAEFWADGPDSETPPGHWFTILNYVNDHPQLEKRFEGTGPILDDLEWDVKAYFTLGAALHDAAVAAWGVKGWYDYIRPISALRGMAELGQSSDPNLPSYHIGGLPLIPGLIELVELGDPLAGSGNQNIGKIKINAWRGPDFLDTNSEAGVGWILAADWWPYQRPTFVTPNFAGYVSGHSTFSRTAAEVLTAFTGDPFFPGGMGEFEAPQNNFLVFEEGPSESLTLQWATYRDASDQCSLSRIWGGIHPPADDIPGRMMGIKIGNDAFALAKQYIDGDRCNLEIPLSEGWNFISTNCIPDDLAVESVFASVNSSVIQVKDLSSTYLPSLGVNTIGNWDITKGYQVKMLNDAVLQIGGTKVDPTQTPIQLTMGWNALGYLLDGESDPNASLTDILPNIIQLKNLNATFLPSIGLNTIGNLKPTEGYQIKMTADDVLVYPESSIIP